MLKKIGFIVLGLVAVLSVVGAASAQDTTKTPSADQAQAAQPPLPATGGTGIGRELLQIVAQDLNLQPRELLQQMRGKTLNDVITAQNGDVAKITADVIAAVTTRVNQAVTDGQITQERATQILGNLSDTVTQALDGQLRNNLLGRLGGLRPGLGGQRSGQGGQVRPNLLNRDVSPLLSAVRDTLGLTNQQIAEELRGGKTLNDVITAHNGDANAIVDAAVTTATQRLDKVRTNGGLTQDQENAMLDGLKAFYQAVLNGAFRPQQTQAVTGSV